MLQIRGFHETALVVSDLERSEQFYTWAAGNACAVTHFQAQCHVTGGHGSISGAMATWGTRHNSGCRIWQNPLCNGY